MGSELPGRRERSRSQLPAHCQSYQADIQLVVKWWRSGKSWIWQRLIEIDQKLATVSEGVCHARPVSFRALSGAGDSACGLGLLVGFERKVDLLGPQGAIRAWWTVEGDADTVFCLR